MNRVLQRTPMSSMLLVAVDGDTTARVGTCTISSLTLSNVGANNTNFTLFDVADPADIVSGDRILFQGLIQGNTTLQFQFNELLVASGVTMQFAYGSATQCIACIEIG